MVELHAAKKVVLLIIKSNLEFLFLQSKRERASANKRETEKEKESLRKREIERESAPVSFYGKKNVDITKSLVRYNLELIYFALHTTQEKKQILLLLSYFVFMLASKL